MSVISRKSKHIFFPLLFILTQDKTIERLRQSVTKVETLKEKTAAKTDNLKTPSDPAEQGARPEKETAHQTPAQSLPDPSTVRAVLKGLSGREQEVSFL